MLELNGVTKQYLYGARLFGALDLTVEDGETLVVLGGEKSGKTTFLKTVAGIEKCEGEILLDGMPIKTKTNDVIMLFDDGAVFKNKTVFDNLAYPLSIRKMDKKEIANRVISAAEMLGIGACLTMRARKLTPLEKRKMSVCRLFLRDAKLLLIDDLTAGLPAKEARELFEDVLRLVRTARNNSTVIIATSEPSEAIAVGGRILVLTDGEVKQIGTAKELWAEPQTIWSAQAVDRDYNFIKCTLSDENGTLNLVFGNEGARYELDVTELKSRILPAYIGREVLVGFHPSDVSDGGMTEKVVGAKGTERGFVLETESGVKIASTENKSIVSYSPSVSSITLYDAATENSIMRKA